MSASEISDAFAQFELVYQAHTITRSFDYEGNNLGHEVLEGLQLYSKKILFVSANDLIKELFQWF